MQKFIGVKLVDAEPQDCQKDDYKSKIGDPGYKVVYEDGYTSWCPKKQFEDANVKASGGIVNIVIAILEKLGKQLDSAGRVQL